jgi:hypothetical protein
MQTSYINLCPNLFALLVCVALVFSCATAPAQSLINISSCVQTATNRALAEIDRANCLTEIRNSGTNAAEAIRPLTWLLTNETNDYLLSLTVEAVGEIGPAGKPSVPALCRILGDNRNEMSWARAEVALALGKIGPTAKESVGTLVTCLTNRNNSKPLRRNAARALGTIHAKPDISVPALLQIVRDTGEDEELQLNAIIAIKQFRGGARDALPTLVDICAGRWETVRYPQEAADAICVIAEGLVVGSNNLTKKQLDELNTLLREARAEFDNLQGLVPHSLCVRLDVVIGALSNSTPVNLIPTTPQQPQGLWQEIIRWLAIGIISPVLLILVICVVISVFPMNLIFRIDSFVEDIRRYLLPYGPVLRHTFSFFCYSKFNNARWISSSVPRRRDYFTSRAPMDGWLHQCDQPGEPLRPLQDLVLCGSLDSLLDDKIQRLLVAGSAEATMATIQVVRDWAISSAGNGNRQKPLLTVIVHSSSNTNGQLLKSIKPILQAECDILNIPKALIIRMSKQGLLVLFYVFDKAKLPTTKDDLLNIYGKTPFLKTMFFSEAFDPQITGWKRISVLPVS